MVRASDANDDAGDDSIEAVPLVVKADADLLEKLRTRRGFENPGEVLEISNLDLTNVELPAADLSGAEIAESLFVWAGLNGARFISATLDSVSFEGAQLAGASFRDAEITDTDFSGADLQDADFRGAMLEITTFRDANLARAVFEGGAAGANFLDAANVQGMDILEIDEYDMDAVERVALHERGARAHSGERCPACLSHDPAFGVGTGVDPSCETCGGEGFVHWSPEEERQTRPVDCLWCGGSGSFVSMVAGSGCQVCDGIGRVDAWGINRRRVLSKADAGGGLASYRFGRTEISGENLWSDEYVGGHIEDASFSSCSFESVEFVGASLVNVVFDHCNLANADFSRVTLRDVTFNACNMLDSVWTAAMFHAVIADPEQFADAQISGELLASVKSGGARTPAN